MLKLFGSLSDSSLLGTNGVHPRVKIVALGDEVIEPLVDLMENVRSRSVDVLVPQLDQHLGDASDGADRVNGIILARCD